MNFRSRALLSLCYEFDCLLQIEGVCTGGTGEPCHANWPEHGKGMGMKAHDCYAVPGCRACHMALDQGSKLSGEQRKDIWHRAFWKFLAMLWNRGMLRVSLHDTDGMCPNCVTPWKCNGPHLGGEAKPLRDERGTLEVSKTTQRKRKGSARGTHCQRPEGALPRRYTTR